MRMLIARSAGLVIAAVTMLFLTAGTPQAAARPASAAVVAAPISTVVDQAAVVQPIQYYYGRRYYRPRYYAPRYYRPRYYGYRPRYYRPRYYGYRRGYYR